VRRAPAPVPTSQQFKGIALFCHAYPLLAGSDRPATSETFVGQRARLMWVRALGFHAGAAKSSAVLFYLVGAAAVVVLERGRRLGLQRRGDGFSE
jgi:hypothetical protein